ncbi:MAG: hypothetical protein HOK24_11645 [Desulfobacula sp.]|uniref:hypothetical protein n=1 Tax=Desulfobacula sp. TaxID=2593537 RepID=UPI001D4423C6|nr:hypothetical protein [Desulfobacula sp.]MBT4025332.1 hypothetical protein [Desulfobacula sp.]MBT5545117.1 hypothetical protein [Desulfobacula sp.]MBT5971913.1 hypothetical protein [Desulfobacula sp.]MBT7792090.1 hypothetical protein [Desulfobacula sp.]
MGDFEVATTGGFWVAIGGWARKYFSSASPIHEYDNFKITQAYLELRVPETDIRFIAGRYDPGRVDDFWIDGGMIDFSVKETTISLYGGKPVSFYYNPVADILAGFSFIKNKKWRTQFKTDLIFLKDNNGWSDIALFNIYQNFPKYFTRAYAKVRTYERKLGDLFLKLLMLPAKSNANISLDYFFQKTGNLKTDSLFRDYSGGYESIFGKRFGFQKLGLSCQYPVLEKTLLTANGTVKKNTNTDETYNWNNIDSNVISIGLQQFEFFHPKINLVLFGNYIDNPDNQFYDISGAVDYEIGKRASLSFGMTYTGYTFGDLEFPDTLNGQESVYELYGHVGNKIYFAEYEIKLKKNRRFAIEIAYEDNGSGYEDMIIVNLKYKLQF